MVDFVLEKIGVADWLSEVGMLNLVRFLISAAWAIVVVYILFWISKRLFSSRFKSDNRIQIRFVRSIVRVLVVVNAIFWVLNQGENPISFGKMLFQSTAILSAIIGFAAQPVITDIVCGLMIIISKPFEIGDRIELEGNTAGVVKDINLKHVVLTGLDSVEIIIPNSKISSMSLFNMSKNRGKRSVFMKFAVSYDTDVEKAMEIIKNVVISSAYTIQGYQGKYGNEYGPVYFLEYGESALILATTVFHEPDVSTAQVKTDINLRINRAFAANNIEIPYNYVNVVVKDDNNEEQ